MEQNSGTSESTDSIIFGSHVAFSICRSNKQFPQKYASPEFLMTRWPQSLE